MSLEEKIVYKDAIHKVGLVNSCGTQTSSIDISHLGQVIIYCFPGNVSGIYYLLLIRISRIFSIALIKSVFVIARRSLQFFIFQVKIAIS